MLQESSSVVRTVTFFFGSVNLGGLCSACDIERVNSTPNVAATSGDIETAVFEDSGGFLQHRAGGRFAQRGAAGQAFSQSSSQPSAARRAAHRAAAKRQSSLDGAGFVDSDRKPLDSRLRGRLRAWNRRPTLSGRGQATQTSEFTRQSSRDQIARLAQAPRPAILPFPLCVSRRLCVDEASP